MSEAAGGLPLAMSLNRSIEVGARLDGSLEDDPCAFRIGAGSSKESIRVCVAEHADVPAPGDEVSVVAQGVILRLHPGRAVLGVEQVECDVAADDPLPPDVRWCFHQRGV